MCRVAYIDRSLKRRSPYTVASSAKRLFISSSDSTSRGVMVRANEQGNYLF